VEAILIAMHLENLYGPIAGFIVFLVFIAGLWFFRHLLLFWEQHKRMDERLRGAYAANRDPSADPEQPRLIMRYEVLQEAKRAADILEKYLPAYGERQDRLLKTVEEMMMLARQDQATLYERMNGFIESYKQLMLILERIVTEKASEKASE
jgi:signal transduction histidine kinase